MDWSKVDIIRILAGQNGNFAAMADVSAFSIAYISEPHFTMDFVGDVTLWSDRGLK